MKTNAEFLKMATHKFRGKLVIYFLPEDPAPICPPRRDHLGVKTCQVPVVVPPRAMDPGQVRVRGWAGVQGGGALISG